MKQEGLRDTSSSDTTIGSKHTNFLNKAKTTTTSHVNFGNLPATHNSGWMLKNFQPFSFANTIIAMDNTNHEEVKNSIKIICCMIMRVLIIYFQTETI